MEDTDTMSKDSFVTESEMDSNFFIMFGIALLMSVAALIASSIIAYTMNTNLEERVTAVEQCHEELHNLVR